MTLVHLTRLQWVFQLCLAHWESQCLLQHPINRRENGGSCTKAVLKRSSHVHFGSQLLNPKSLFFKPQAGESVSYSSHIWILPTLVTNVSVLWTTWHVASKGSGEFSVPQSPCASHSVVHPALVFWSLQEGMFSLLGSQKSDRILKRNLIILLKDLASHLACLICLDTIWGIFDIHVVQAVNYSIGTGHKTLTTLSQLVMGEVWGQPLSLGASLKLTRSDFSSLGPEMRYI